MVTLESNFATALELQRRALAVLPLNSAVLAGSDATLNCRAADPPPTSNVEWGEYVWNGDGSYGIISDGVVVNPGHPEADRYAIVNDDPTQFDLNILNTTTRDGGTYVCQDINDSPPNTNIGSAELVVLDNDPNCTTTLIFGGGVTVIVEGEYHTVECTVGYQGNIVPTMTWMNFNFNWTTAAYNNISVEDSNNTVTSTLSFYADRSQNNGWLRCITNFTTLGFEPGPSNATNLPTYTASSEHDGNAYQTVLPTG